MITLSCDQVVTLHAGTALARIGYCLAEIELDSVIDLQGWWVAKNKGEIKVVYCPEHYERVKGMVLI